MMPFFVAITAKWPGENSLHRQDGLNLLARLEGKKIDHGLSQRRRPDLGYFIDFEPEDLPAVGE